MSALGCDACATMLCIAGHLVPLLNLVVLGAIFWRMLRDHHR